MNRFVLILLNFVIFQVGICVILLKQSPKPEASLVQQEITSPYESPKPIRYKISDPIPVALSDSRQLVSQLEQWRKEAPRLIKVGIYGKSSQGQDLYFAKITGANQKQKQSVLITACIHGNEPLSTAIIMACLGSMLDGYGKDYHITELLDKRQIWFVPIVSPDSYPSSRRVDGVDPNRDFPTLKQPNKKSVPPVEAIKELFLQIKPRSIISAHTSGRVFLMPWGDQKSDCPHHNDYLSVFNKMSQASGYKIKKASQVYGRPILGSEIDWYYRQGAFSMVLELGTHQRLPTHEEIKYEFDRIFPAILIFIEEAPLIEVQNLKKAA